MEKRKNAYRETDLSDMVQAYLECAEWTDSEGIEQGAEFSDNAKAEALEACKAFAFQVNAPDWDYPGYDLEQMGHDFWLSRNGHGAGFFDRDQLPKSVRDFAQAKAEAWGECSVFANDGLQLEFDSVRWNGEGCKLDVIELSNGDLAITCTGLIAADTSDDSILSEALDWYQGNGGPYFVSAEVTGDLTDSPIVVSEYDILEDGPPIVPDDSRKWYMPNYAIRGLAQDMQRDGFAVLTEVKES